MSAPTTNRATRAGVAAATGGDPLAEAIELTRRLKLPHIRRHLVELVRPPEHNAGTTPN